MTAKITNIYLSGESILVDVEFSDRSTKQYSFGSMVSIDEIKSTIGRDMIVMDDRAKALQELTPYINATITLSRYSDEWRGDRVSITQSRIDI